MIKVKDFGPWRMVMDTENPTVGSRVRVDHESGVVCAVAFDGGVCVQFSTCHATFSKAQWSQLKSEGRVEYPVQQDSTLAWEKQASAEQKRGVMAGQAVIIRGDVGRVVNVTEDLVDVALNQGVFQFSAAAWDKLMNKGYVNTNPNMISDPEDGIQGMWVSVDDREGVIEYARGNLIGVRFHGDRDLTTYSKRNWFQMHCMGRLKSGKALLPQSKVDETDQCESEQAPAETQEPRDLRERLARLMELAPDAPDDVLFDNVEKAWREHVAEQKEQDERVGRLKAQRDRAYEANMRIADVHGELQREYGQLHKRFQQVLAELDKAKGKW